MIDGKTIGLMDGCFVGIVEGSNEGADAGPVGELVTVGGLVSTSKVTVGELVSR